MHTRRLKDAQVSWCFINSRRQGRADESCETWQRVGLGIMYGPHLRSSGIGGRL